MSRAVWGYDNAPRESFFHTLKVELVHQRRGRRATRHEAVNPAARDAAFDLLKLAVGAAIAADRTLGGLCDYLQGEAPATVELPIEGAEGLKAASVGIILSYATSDPLS